MNHEVPTTPEHADANVPATAEPNASSMPPTTKAVLRRRFLQGGAAVVPLIVTFGRPSSAAAASIDCFVRAGFASPSEAFYDTRSRELFLQSLQSNALGGSLTPEQFLANLEASGFACAVSLDIDFTNLQTA
jgi:hypothetical protein